MPNSELRLGSADLLPKASNSSKRTSGRCWSRSATSAIRPTPRCCKAACGSIRPSDAGRRRLGPGRRAEQAGRKPADLGAALRIERDAADRQAAGRGDRRLREMDLAGCARSAHRSRGRRQSQRRKADPRDHWAFQAAAAHRAAASCDTKRPCAIGYRPLHPRQAGSGRACRRRRKPRRARCCGGLYYDLIGLPPTAEELDEFAADPSDARYEATVDRLLASPRFGERWARHWLDVARYADTKGYVFEEDRNYKQAYTYRDWVIASFNADRPFDQFVVAQIAADQIDDPSCAPAIGLPHARPPVPQRSARHHQRSHRRRDARPHGPHRRLRPLPRSQVRSDQRGRLLRAVRRVRQLAGKAARRCAADAGRRRQAVRPVRVSARQPRQPRARMSSGDFLTCLSPDNKPQPFKHGSGRRELAEAIASRDNPLTARVWVNRVWGHLFGHGLVRHAERFRRPRHAADAS